MSNNLIIFTDGACIKNGKKNAKAGIGIHFPNGEFEDVSIEFTKNPITNQRAELYSIYTALQKIVNDPTHNTSTVTIYSDSLYSIKSITIWIKNWEKNGWKTANGKPVQNLDIIKPIYEIVNTKTVTFKHVLAHTKATTFEAIGNDKADNLATTVIKNIAIRNM
jgi:ribonuclease HI